jgi:uncharacterized protein YfaS (alpha-2-macroglobulin family)
MNRSPLNLVLTAALGLTALLSSCRPSAHPTTDSQTVAPVSTPTGRIYTSTPRAADSGIGVKVQPGSSLEGSYLPDEAVTLEFNQAMIEADEPYSFQISPYVRGTFNWDEGMTRLTFASEDPLEPGKIYSIMLPEELKSASGEQLGRHELLQFRVAPTPRVLGHRPGTSVLETDRWPEIHVVFDRPMERASVAAQLQVRPAIEYDLEWQDEASLSIMLAEPLLTGQRYQFVIRAGARAQDGMALASDYAWEYAADPLTLRVSGPLKAIPIGRIGLRFNYAIDPDSLPGALEISPPLEFELTVSDDGKSALLDLQTQLQPGVLYQFNLHTSLSDRTGFSFHTPVTASLASPPPIADHGPQEIDDRETRRTIWIEFDRPMNQQSVQSAFSVEPYIPGWFSWEGNRLIYHLLETYDPWTEYEVTLGTGAQTADGGRALVSAYRWEFASPYIPGIASFGEAGEKIQVVDADGRRAVQFGTSEAGAVRIFFDLLPLEMRQVVELGVQNPSFTNPKPSTIADELESVRTWEIVVPSNGYGSLQEMTIPGDVAPGLYLLQMRVGSQVQDHLVLALSSHTLGVKYAGRQLSVWATDIHGDPVPELEIRVYTDDGRHVREDRTDEDGLYETTLAGGDQPQLIFGRDENGDITIAGVGSTWSAGYYWWSRPRTVETSEYMAYVYTERPIYRPGQEVNFKAIIRRDYDGVFDLLPFGTPVEAALIDSRGNAISTETLRTNSFGSVFGSFEIAEAAALGTYHVQLDVNGESHLGEFKVEDYRKPDIQLSVEAEKSTYIDGETIIVNITARYFHGEPVANAEITLRDYRLGEFYGYWWEESASNEVEYVWYPGFNRSISGRTDSNGILRLEYPARLPDDYLVWSDWRSNLKWSTWGLEASIDDGSHQDISAFAVVKVYNTGEALTLDSGGYAHAADDPVRLEASLRTLDDITVPGRELKLMLSRWDRLSTTFTAYKVERTGTTDASGKLSFDLGRLPAGYYLAEISGHDSSGRPLEVRRYFGVYSSDDFSGWYSSNDEFTVTADRESYRPYETASIFIESTQDGPAWVTIERGSVRRQQVIELTAPLTEYDFTVLESDAPNVFVTVNTWQPGVDLQDWGYWYTNVRESVFQTASVELEVEPLGKELKIEIETDRELYLPGDEVVVKLTVRDGSGDPVPAEISLAVIDEAIFSLSEELNVSIFEAFYGRRSHSVLTYNSMAPWREIWVEGRGGGGGDGSQSPAALRSEFLDTALWYPALRTNSHGEITVTMTLPDNLTQWRLTAKAVTLSHAVGESSATIRTHQPIVLRPVLPRFLTAGDKFKLATFVYNYSETARELPVRLDSDELVILDRAVQSIMLEPGGSAIVSWNVRAETAGEAAIQLRAGAGADGDAVRIDLTVNPLSVPDLLAEAGRVDDSHSIEVDMPEGVLPMSSVQLELSRSITGNLLSGLEYLTGYPYGCVEQIMSKALPNAVIGKALRQLDQLELAPGDLDRMVEDGIQMLYAKQHYDGGWGWWYDDATHDYQTAWVLFGLATTRDAGYAVDDDVIQGGADWLLQHLESMDPRTEAFALYSLSAAGYTQLGASLDLFDERQSLDAFSRAALAIVLEADGKHAEAQILLNELLDVIVQESGSAFWLSPFEDGHYYDKAMASSTRSTAMALSAMLTIKPDQELTDQIVRWLMSQRRTYGWGTTNETAFAILALSDYVLTTREAAESSGYRVLLNGSAIAQGTLTAEQPRLEITVRADQLKDGINRLRISQTDAGLLYYSLVAQRYLPQAEIGPAGSIRVERRYLNARTRTPLDRAELGQLVMVELKINMTRDGFYMLIEDHLPGGLEALNEGLNTSSHEFTQYGDPEYRWSALGYNYKEVRADRVTFFVTETDRGEVTLRYFARASQEGRFTSLPAEAYGMYDASLWGRSSSAVIEVGAESTAGTDSRGVAAAVTEDVPLP